MLRKIKCTCGCHSNPGMLHFMACCDNGYKETEVYDNELIAKFDGMEFDEDGFCTDPSRKYSWRIGCYDPLTVDLLHYHESWNWLMPVVVLIEEMGHAVNICQEDVAIIEHESFSSLKEIIQVSGEHKLEATYKAVVRFIKWHNENIQAK